MWGSVLAVVAALGVTIPLVVLLMQKWIENTTSEGERRRRIRRAAIIVPVGAALIIMLIIGGRALYQWESPGGLDLTGECHDRFGDASTSTPLHGDPYQWSCETTTEPHRILLRFDLAFFQAYCTAHYPGSHPRLLSPGNTNSWRCVRY
jgi:hypothetical protein